MKRNLKIENYFIVLKAKIYKTIYWTILEGISFLNKNLIWLQNLSRGSLLHNQNNGL